MAKLQEYVAPQKELRPSNEGFNAFETAGRRVGGMYREAGADLARAATANAATLTNTDQWPFTLYALKQKFMAQKAQSGMNFRTAVAGSSAADEQFANRVMPNLSLENAQANATDGTPGGISSLTPEGAHQATLDAQAALLTGQLQGLIGAGDPTGGMNGPAPTYNTDAQASANQWGWGAGNTLGSNGYQGSPQPIGQNSGVIDNGGASADTGLAGALDTGSAAAF